MDSSTVFNVLLFVVICALTSRAKVQANCTEGEVRGEACRSHQVCQNGQWVQIDCAYPEESYDFDTKQCVPTTEAAPPCNGIMDCNGLEGSYPDIGFDCQWFFTCHNEIYVGHQTCAEGLVFQQATQICNWPASVGPPCGTCDTCEY